MTVRALLVFGCLALSACNANGTALASLEVRADLPDGAVITDFHDRVSIQAGALTLGIRKAGTLTEVGKTSRALPAVGVSSRFSREYSPNNVHTETLSDGWLLTYETKNGRDTVYSLLAHREIGGQPYHCYAAVADGSLLAQSVQICRSLRDG